VAFFGPRKRVFDYGVSALLCFERVSSIFPRSPFIDFTSADTLVIPTDRREGSSIAERKDFRVFFDGVKMSPMHMTSPIAARQTSPLAELLS